MADASPSSIDLLHAFVEAVNRNEAVAMLTVVKSQAEGAPPPGAKLVAWADGRVMGSFTAAYDAVVLDDARQSLTRGESQSFIYPKPSGGRTRRAERLAELEVYVEVVRPPTLLVVGAGHVGNSVARLAKFVGFQVAVIDDREEFANSERFPEADQVICDDFIAALERFPINQSTYIVVVTRGHKQDETSVRAAIDAPAAYIGMIGSKRRAGAVLKLLRESGVSAEALARVRTPIGLDISAETPEEIAVSIIAEIVLTRHGGSGLPMSQVERAAFRE